MNGEKIKMTIRGHGFTLADVADKLKMSSQNLSAQLVKDDIRTGLLEKISDATEIPIAAFYGENVASASGNGSAAVAGTGNSVNINQMQREFLNEVAEQRKLTQQAQDNTARLLGIVEELTKK